jgi:molecular chaperone GrpE (heat shock protein)
LRNGDTGLASFGVEPRVDGIYVEHSEYWKLFEEVTRLKAEVERLTNAAMQVHQELDEFGQVSAKSVHELRDAAKGVQS